VRDPEINICWTLNNSIKNTTLHKKSTIIINIDIHIHQWLIPTVRCNCRDNWNSNHNKSSSTPHVLHQKLFKLNIPQTLPENQLHLSCQCSVALLQQSHLNLNNTQSVTQLVVGGWLQFLFNQPVFTAAKEGVLPGTCPSVIRINQTGVDKF